MQGRAKRSYVLKDTPPKGYDPKLSPKELQTQISYLGIKKANTKIWQLFLLGILAGLYISIGGHAFLVALEQGMGKIIAGAVFSVGLVLVVIAGAELFTGNIMMIVGAISTFFPIRKMLKNWTVVYLGNFVGAFLFAFLIFKSGLLGTHLDINKLGQLAIKISADKLNLSFTECFIRGIFCNMLVILAIIMAYFSKDIISKIFCCILPIMVFVASGFEHCVANMYLIPIGLFVKGVPFYKQYIIFQNLIPVTLGNIAGGLFILVIHPNRIRQLIALFSHKPSSRTNTK
ncbi:formate/nitrite transporter family protein [bacterium]|nr:formate/nitrite transporter family protein [bacterium]